MFVIAAGIPKYHYQSSSNHPSYHKRGVIFHKNHSIAKESSHLSLSTITSIHIYIPQMVLIFLIYFLPSTHLHNETFSSPQSFVLWSFPLSFHPGFFSLYHFSYRQHLLSTATTMETTNSLNMQMPSTSKVI